MPKILKSEGRIIRWSWNNKMGHRGRKRRCLIVGPDGIVHPFTGNDISGVVRVANWEHYRDGKWSSNTYYCISPSGAVPISWLDDWGTGRVFSFSTWEDSLEWIKKSAPHVNMESWKKHVREYFPEFATEWDETEHVIAEFSKAEEKPE